ncbi:MAG: guanylate kinase [Burkholderiaceae bacterium]
MTEPSEQPALSGSLFIIVAPSGAGKTSLVRALLDQHAGLQLSISFTTRAPRPGELDGRDYRFIDRADFERRRAGGEFLECAEVHGNLYGTSREWIAERMATGADILLEIDWQGAEQVASQIPDAVRIFIVPPSIEELRMRLRRRGQDDEQTIERRVQAAARELQEANRCEYVIINQDFASALADLSAVVRGARTRFRQQFARHEALFERLGIRPPAG